VEGVGEPDPVFVLAFLDSIKIEASFENFLEQRRKLMEIRMKTYFEGL
jgi:hypothetical protein